MNHNQRNTCQIISSIIITFGSKYRSLFARRLKARSFPIAISLPVAMLKLFDTCVTYVLNLEGNSLLKGKVEAMSDVLLHCLRFIFYFKVLFRSFVSLKLWYLIATIKIS